MFAALQLAGLLLHQASPATAAESLVWEVPRGCPERAALKRAIARRLGRRLAPGELALAGRISRHTGAPRFRLRLELTLDGHTQARTLTGEHCSALADAAALLVALAVAPAAAASAAPPRPGPRDSRAGSDDASEEAVPAPPAHAGAVPGAGESELPTHDASPGAGESDLPTHDASPGAGEAPHSAAPGPDAASREPPLPARAAATLATAPDAPPSAATDASPETADEPRRARPRTGAPPPPGRRRPGALMRVHGGPELGAVPGPTGTLGLAAGLLWRRARLELQGNGLAPRTVTRGASELQVSGLAAAVHGCARLGRGRFELPLCGGLEAGGVHGRARGPGAHSGTGLWLAGVVSAGVAWHPHARVSLSLALQGVVPVIWPRFELRDPGATVTLFEAAAVTGRLLVGLELRLGDPW